MFILKLFSSIFQTNTDQAAPEREIVETKPIKDELPKVMLFREVVAPTNRIGDIFWLPSSTGKKVLAVNFDFEKCGWTGMPKLELDDNDPSKGKVILGDGREVEARIKLLPKVKADEEKVSEEVW